MGDRTPAEAERDLAWGRLSTEELPDLAARWLADGSYDSPSLRELAGQPSKDPDGVRALWACVRSELGLAAAQPMELGRLTRQQFLDVVRDLDRTLGPGATTLGDDAAQLLNWLWSALNSASAPQIDGLSAEEESLIVRAYGQYCESLDTSLEPQEHREATADAVGAVRDLAATLDGERSGRILDAVLAELARSRTTESRWVSVLGAWTARPHTICILYRFHGYPCTIGLRRVLDAELPEAVVVDEIATYEIGEPLGTVFDERYIGPDDVFWWDGSRPIRPDDAPRRPPANRGNASRRNN